MAQRRSSTSVGNRLLRRLSDSDYRLVAEHLEFLELPIRHQIERANYPVSYVYLLEEGVASIVASQPGGLAAEVGLVGREGATGLCVVMGTRRSPFETYMQVAGKGHRLSADALRQLMLESSTLREEFLRSGFALFVQTSRTALANSRNTIDERLARWILMAQDRLDGDEFSLTHEFLALMLAVRRPGVTQALAVLRDLGVIETRRSLLKVVDRAALERASGGSYGQPEISIRENFC